MDILQLPGRDIHPIEVIISEPRSEFFTEVGHIVKVLHSGLGVFVSSSSEEPRCIPTYNILPLTKENLNRVQALKLLIDQTENLTLALRRLSLSSPTLKELS